MSVTDLHAIRESARIEALRKLRIMDTVPQPELDRLVALAADLMSAPVAAISLLDDHRAFTKAGFGVDPCSTSREDAFCHHALMLDPHAVLVIEDATLDERVRDNPVVVGEPHFRFYMGALLTNSAGYNLGTLCVLDHAPRPSPNARDIARLQSLAQLVVREMERSQQDRLHVERDRLLAMAEIMSGVGHWSYDITTGAVRWSDEVYAIHGLDRATFDPMVDDAVSFYHPEDRPVLQAQLARSIETGEGYDFQLRINRADGALRHVTAKATCERDSAGKVISMFGVFQDVTDQVSTLADIRRGKARYKVLTETMSDVVVRVRLDGSSPYISPRVYDLLGYHPNEMAGYASHHFVADIDKPQCSRSTRPWPRVGRRPRSAIGPSIRTVA